jgi:hypothetical protein
LRRRRRRTKDPKGPKERDQHEQEIDDVVGDEVPLVRCEIEPDAVFEDEGHPDQPVVEGRVISVQARESERWGTRYGMVLRLRNGTTVWTSVPRSLDEAVGMEPELLRGQRVRFTATFEPAGPRFAFARRPRDAQML